ALRGRGAVAATYAPRRAARDRADAPDPRAPRRDRAAGRRRPRLRRPGPRAAPAVPARGGARVPPSVHGRAGRDAIGAPAGPREGPRPGAGRMKAQVRVSLDALRHVQEHGGCLFVWREDATVRAATTQPRPGIWSRQRADGFD